MAGIYIHIPFCKQACNYCNFHFVTSLQRKNELLEALLKEAEIRADYILNEKVETIYIGGGTPSLIGSEEINKLITTVKRIYHVDPEAEVTMEANPDDITVDRLKQWKENGINRLSIGVQSFFEEDLRWMNRAHNSNQALQCLEDSIREFDNITVDLIYGTPFLTDEKWKLNVEKAIALGIPHLSCYALTVEPKTPLQKLIAQKKSEDVDPDRQSQQLLLLMEWMALGGYEHYEISNFAKPGYRSRHNSSYWQGKTYIGLGPSAHSYDGTSRQWNIANNAIYIENLTKGIVPYDKEELTEIQRINEYIMTSLRTVEGIDLNRMKEEDAKKLRIGSKKYVDNNLMRSTESTLVLTNEGKLLADGIAADLFFDQG